MKRFLPALLLAVATAAPAQTPPNGTLISKSESGNGQTISVADGKSISSMSHSGNLVPGFKKAFRLLQVGRSYVFPDAFTVAADDSAEFENANLLSLEQRLPFRALVDQVQVMDQRIVLRLCCADGKKVEFVHTGTADHDKAAAMVSGLQPEETYEFPAILQGKRPTPPADGGGPLAQYIGEWRGTLEGDPSFYITMSCAWMADGQGMWREIMYDDGTDAPPVYDVAVVTTKGGGSLLLAQDPHHKDKPAVESAYEASSRTFTTRLSSPDPAIIRINSATFSSDNTIAWKTESQNSEGTVLATTSGSYQKLVRMSQITDSLSHASVKTSPGQIFADIQNTRFNPSSSTKEILGLPNLPPFRATVLKRQISPSAIHIELKINDVVTITVSHTTQTNWDKAKTMVEHLEENHTYEFPDALAEGFLALPPGTTPQPASDAMRALAPFVGTWEGEFGTEKKKGVIRYFWKDDGTGLWRESGSTPADDKAKQGEDLHPRPCLITYDETRQCYVESPPLVISRSESIINGTRTVAYGIGAPTSLPRSQMALWNAATQTYTWQYTRDQPQPNTQYSGTRRLVSPDRIEWKSQMTAEDGSALQEHSGHYDRVSQ